VALQLEPMALQLESMALQLESMALQLETMVLQLVALQLDLIALQLEPMALQLETMVLQLEPMALQLETMVLQLVALQLDLIALRTKRGMLLIQSLKRSSGVSSESGRRRTALKGSLEQKDVQGHSTMSCALSMGHSVCQLLKENCARVIVAMSRVASTPVRQSKEHLIIKERTCFL